jgi:hypothetical protein
MSLLLKTESFTYLQTIGTAGSRGTFSLYVSNELFSFAPIIKLLEQITIQINFVCVYVCMHVKCAHTHLRVHTRTHKCKKIQKTFMLTRVHTQINVTSPNTSKFIDSKSVWQHVMHDSMSVWQHVMYDSMWCIRLKEWKGYPQKPHLDMQNVKLLVETSVGFTLLDKIQVGNVTTSVQFI